MAQLAQHHLQGASDRSIPEVIGQIIEAALAAHAVNPKLHRILHEQVPHSEVMRRLDEAKIENMLRSFLAQRCDQLQPLNLDLTVFMIERTIRSLIYGAMNKHPEFLKTGELQQEIVAMLSAYLVKK